MIPRAFALLAVVGLNVWCFTVFTGGELLAVHACCALAAGAVLAGGAPFFVSCAPRSLAAYAAVTAFFIPILGALGVLAVLFFGLREPPQTTREPWLVFAAENADRTKRAKVSAAAIGEVLRVRTAETATKRFQALLGVRWLSPRAAVPLLKLAQSDPMEELRLFAFSTLERMRRDLEKQSEELVVALRTAEPRQRARLHLRLAECYWELGYEGLIEGAVLAHALSQADEHAEAASQERTVAATAEFLRGKVLLHVRQPARAKKSLERALRAGFPRVKALPYMAECAFQQRELHSVSELLFELEATAVHIDAALRPVLDLWRLPKECVS